MNRPLLFIPGWGMGASVFTPTIDALGATHTRSIELPASGHTLTEWAQQIATTLTPNTVLCGWSLGGMLALELALELAQQRPDTIAALVLISTTPRFIADEHWPHGVTPQAFQAFEHLLQNDPPALLRQFITLQSMGDPHPERWPAAWPSTHPLHHTWPRVYPSCGTPTCAHPPRSSRSPPC